MNAEPLNADETRGRDSSLGVTAIADFPRARLVTRVGVGLMARRIRLAVLWSRGGPPVLLYLAGQLLYALVAYWYGFDWLSADSRIRWDGGIYLDIAHTGYYAGPCTEINPSVHVPHAFCGNAGWFPLYPYLVLFLTKATGLELSASGVLVTEMCALAMLIAVWHLLGTAATAPKLACLAVAAAFPSGVYFHATFPMSVSVLLALVTFALLVRGRWLLAGLTGATTAAAYPLAVLLAPASVALLLIPRGRWSWRRLATAAYVGGLTVSGLLGVFGLLYLTTGRFDAYLLIQTSNYGHGIHNPVNTFLVLLDRSPWAVSAEMVFGISLLALALLALRGAAARGQATVLDWTLATVYGPLLLVVPLIVGANQAQFRSHTLLLPLVLLLRHLRISVTAMLATVAVPLAFVMTTLFLTGVLV